MPSDDHWRRQLAWILFWSCNIFIFQGAVLPPDKIPGFLVRMNDAFLHGAQYFLLFFAGFHAFRIARSAWFHCRPLFNALLWCFLMGLFTEAAQAFVPGRHPSLADWTADFVGASIGVILYMVFRRSAY